MRQILLSLCATLSIMTSVAQNNINGPKPVKETVYMDYFTRSSSVPSSECDMVRNNVLAGINSTSRVTILDVDAEPTLKIDKSIDNGTSEDVVTMDNVRLGAMKSAGGKYVMTGTVNKAGWISKRTSEGKTYYEGQIIFTLKVVDTETGETKSTKSFDQKSTDFDNGSKALQGAVNSVKGVMNDFVNEVFQLTGCIIQFGDPDKKGKIKEVYINCGSTVGVRSGQTFNVYTEKEIGGMKTRSKIGRLVFKESMGEEVSLCKVVDGDAAIKEAGNADKPIIVITDNTRFLTTLFGS